MLAELHGTLQQYNWGRLGPAGVCNYFPTPCSAPPDCDQQATFVPHFGLYIALGTLYAVCFFCDTVANTLVGHKDTTFRHAALWCHPCLGIAASNFVAALKWADIRHDFAPRAQRSRICPTNFFSSKATFECCRYRHYANFWRMTQNTTLLSNLPSASLTCFGISLTCYICFICEVTYCTLVARGVKITRSLSPDFANLRLAQAHGALCACRERRSELQGYFGFAVERVAHFYFRVVCVRFWYAVPSQCLIVVLVVCAVCLVVCLFLLGAGGRTPMYMLAKHATPSQ